MESIFLWLNIFLISSVDNAFMDMMKISLVFNIFWLDFVGKKLTRFFWGVWYFIGEKLTVFFEFWFFCGEIDSVVFQMPEVSVFLL